MNDEERTGETRPEEAVTGPTEAIDAPPGPRRLLRSRDDRLVAGVAGGLGRYFSVDPVIVRIAFAISVFFGGLGALAYLALVLFVPADPEPAAAARRPAASGGRSRWLGLAAGAVIALVALSAAGSFFFWDWGWDGGGPWGLLFLLALGLGVYAILRDRESGGPPSAGRSLAIVGLAIVFAIGLTIVGALSGFAAATGSGTVIAVVVIAIGVLLAAAAFVGGARWLIAPALALAIPLGAVSAAEISFAGGVGERFHRPSSLDQLPERYEHGVGRMVIDLRELDWQHSEGPSGRGADLAPRPASASLEADLGVGELIVVVPEQVCVSPALHVGAGEIALGDGSIGGADLDRHGGAGTPEQASLSLEGEVDLGALRVLNSYESDDHGPPFGHFDRDRDRDRAEVC